MPNQNFHVCQPQRRRHRPALIDLGAKIFNKHGYYEFYDYCKNGYVDGSCYNWNNSRIAILEDQFVGHVGIWRYKTRVGSARLITGGLGMVMTHPRFRKLGIARATLSATIDSMRSAGYDISLLFGIRNFYRQFGYAQAWPSVVAEMTAESMSDRTRTYWRRRAPLPRMLKAEGQVGRIYNHDHAGMVGTAIRPLYTKDLHQWRLHELLDARDAVRGYLATEIDGANLMVWEVGGFQTHRGRMELLAQLQHLARQQGCKAVRLHLGAGHPLVSLARTRNCKLTIEHAHNAGAMVRIIDLASCLRKMCGELSRRLADSHLAEVATSLIVRCQGQSATLRLHDGAVSLTERTVRTRNVLSGGPDVARLLIGSDDPQAVIDAGEIRGTGRARELVGVLFPARQPYLPRADWF